MATNTNWSSLKFFAKAKNSVAKIVAEFFDLVIECKEYAADVHPMNDSILAKDEVVLLDEYAEKIKGILEILERKSMKVVFFGRTSNGKSTVVNAMLQDKILPSGIGHTTNCFVQIEGVDGTEAYIKTEDGEKRSVQSLSHLASALSKVRLTSESLIKICWPKHKCLLLQEDVILVDSPGIDLSADVDKWIDKFCLDADVFVLVANAESTLMQTEKNFFHRVSSRLSKPNIFILNNRWDASAHEPETKKEVKQQHLERCTSFLVDELQVLRPEDIDRRVFFVSALETLKFNFSRPPVYQPSDGVEERLDEFVEFQKCFEDCISRAAVETKFAQHVRNVEGVAASLLSLCTRVAEKADHERFSLTSDFEELNSNLKVIEKQFPDCEGYMRERIFETSRKLQAEVSKSLMKELRHLDNLLDDYGKTFDPDNEETMRLYKKDLNFYVEENLTKGLHIKYTPIARSLFLATCRDMIAATCSMMPSSPDEVMNSLSPGQEFEVIYNLNCAGLCSEFVEDIEFRFSLGLTTLVAKCLGKSRLDNYEVSRMIASSTSSSSLIPFTSSSTIGLLAVISIVTKVAGMRMIGMCAAAYVALYLYERLTWTSKVKEQTFKRQYTSFVSHQLRSIIDVLGSSCSQQTERELFSVMNKLHDMVSNYQGTLTEDVEKSETSLKELETASTSAKKFQSKFSSIAKQLKEFRLKYLGPDAGLLSPD